MFGNYKLKGFIVIVFLIPKELLTLSPKTKKSHPCGWDKSLNGADYSAALRALNSSNKLPKEEIISRRNAA